MKKFLHSGVVTIDPENYIKLLIIIVPLLNFLPGFTFDLYTPSMPALSVYYLASIATIKNTVTATLIGFAIGGFISGIVIDAFGTRRIILLGLFFYIITSALAVFCHSIQQLMLVRFAQGLLSGAFTIGCRTIIVDTLKGHQFNVAILYTSLSFGIGPIIGPFIGGILQHHFGWQANFIAYAIMGFIFLLLFSLFISESAKQYNPFSLKRLQKTYKDLLTHKIFISSILLSSCCRIQLILYATVGAFFVQNILHCTAIVFGNTALLVGLSYFLGTLVNRFLIKKWHVNYLMQIGLILLVISSAVQILLALSGELNLLNLVSPVMMICFGIGFINSNLSIRWLKIFPHYAGAATSILISCGLVISSIGIFLISFIDVDDLIRLSAIFAVILAIQLIIFYGFFDRKECE